jgi:hypothetical protein
MTTFSVSWFKIKRFTHYASTALLFFPPPYYSSLINIGALINIGDLLKLARMPGLLGGTII